MMREKIESIFDRLQTLDIKPTLTNMETMLQCLYDLREVYQQIPEQLTEGDGSDGRTADQTQ